MLILCCVVVLLHDIHVYSQMYSCYRFSGLLFCILFMARTRCTVLCTFIVSATVVALTSIFCACLLAYLLCTLHFTFSLLMSLWCSALCCTYFCVSVHEERALWLCTLRLALIPVIHLFSVFCVQQKKFSFFVFFVSFFLNKRALMKIKIFSLLFIDFSIILVSCTFKPWKFFKTIKSNSFSSNVEFETHWICWQQQKYVMILSTILSMNWFLISMYHWKLCDLKTNKKEREAGTQGNTTSHIVTWNSYWILNREEQATKQKKLYFFFSRNKNKFYVKLANKPSAEQRRCETFDKGNHKFVIGHRLNSSKNI